MALHFTPSRSCSRAHVVKRRDVLKDMHVRDQVWSTKLEIERPPLCNA